LSGTFSEDILQSEAAQPVDALAAFTFLAESVVAIDQE
jgi:hypothetical protein